MKMKEEIKMIYEDKLKELIDKCIVIGAMYQKSFGPVIDMDSIKNCSYTSIKNCSYTNDFIKSNAANYGLNEKEICALITYGATHFKYSPKRSIKTKDFLPDILDYLRYSCPDLSYWEFFELFEMIPKLYNYETYFSFKGFSLNDNSSDIHTHKEIYDTKIIESIDNFIIDMMVDDKGANYIKVKQLHDAYKLYAYSLSIDTNDISYKAFTDIIKNILLLKIDDDKILGKKLSSHGKVFIDYIVPSSLI